MKNDPTALPGIRKSRSLIATVMAFIFILTLAGCDSQSERSDAMPGTAVVDSQSSLPSPPGALQATSDGGLFRISLWPRDGSIPLNQLHAWVVQINDATGNQVIPTRIAIDGGMPQHGHGFTTQPRVTKRLSDGDHLVEGMKFHMSGDWQLRLAIVAGGNTDSATFELRLDP